MPVQGPPWTEFLSCHVCFSMFDERLHRPISLACGHTICKTCLPKLQNGKCPFDQSSIAHNVEDLPVNYVLLQLVGAATSEIQRLDKTLTVENPKCYDSCNKCISDLAVHLKTDSEDPKLENIADDDDNKGSLMGNLPSNSVLSRPMQRKLVVLVNCQLMEEEGRARAMRAVRSLGERAVTELILQHQNPHQLSANLWAAVRARGCQFLGPAMQEEVLKLILLVLEDASALSRKVLVLFVVQQLEESYPQASKTAIGHVVQLLYRASCFKVTKREEESSLMQLKEEFRNYEALRREHDSQIVQIAMEAGLRISPEQWSSLLYGDTGHKSHMQSIIDKLQNPQSFSQSINELSVALQRTGDPCNLQRLKAHLEFLASIDPSPDTPATSWENLEAAMKALRTVVQCLVDFFTNYSQKKTEMLPLQNARYKTSMCRDQTHQGACPRGNSCTFAHSQEELEKFRARSKKLGAKRSGFLPTMASLSPKERAELDKVNKLTNQKLSAYSKLAESSSLEKGYEEEKGEKIIDAPLAQSFSEMMLSSKPHQLSDLAGCSPGVNSGIPSGNTTPSVAAPAQYLKPSLGAGPTVKETYYHPRMPHGTIRMTPFEMPGAEGNRFSMGPYPGIPQAQCRPPALGQYPTMQYQQEHSVHGMNPHICGHQPMPPAEQWGAHCCGQEVCGNPPPTPPPPPQPLPQVMMQNYPTYDRQHYCQGQLQPPHHIRPQHVPPQHVPPQHHIQHPQLPGQYGNQGKQSLSDLHTRRNRIIAHLQNQGTLPSPRYVKPQKQLSPNRTTELKSPLCEEVKTNPVSDLSKSVADTYVATRTMFSLANSGCLSEPQPTPSTYVPWSSDDSYDPEDSSEVCAQSNGTWCVDDLCAPEDCEEDDSKSLFSWFEEEQTPARYCDSLSEYHQVSPHDPLFIPFDPPLVSRFGPISRGARSKMKNTDPVQVTADETLKRVTPVTAVKAMECPLPVPAPVPSRFSPWEVPSFAQGPRDTPKRSGGDVLSPMWNAGEESQFMIQSDPTRLSHKRLQREVKRLETQAQGARSQDESLTYELQAIELQISLQTGRKSSARCSTTNSSVWQSTDVSHLGTVRASDPTLTAQEQRKLHELAITFGSSGQKCSEQQEQILTQLLKLKNLGNQASQLHHDWSQM